MKSVPIYNAESPKLDACQSFTANAEPYKNKFRLSIIGYVI